MARILFYLFVVLAMSIGFAWLAGRPGEMVLNFENYRIQLTLMTAAVAVVAVVAATMIFWWLIRSIWQSPHAIARHFRVRRRDRGYQALSTGLIAAGAGDAGLARVKGKEAARLIHADQEPLIHLLEAQTALLEGDHDGARRKFEAMVDDPETRLLGLRGLYLEAGRLGDRDAARIYAGRAAAVAPQLNWATESTIEELAARSQWDGALELVAAQKSTKRIAPDAANRQRAVLLTAKAMELEQSDPAAAKNAALEANRLQPEFVPAALIAAKALLHNDAIRKASKILEQVWRATPHPQVAELYIHARSGDAVLDRMKRARKLQALQKDSAEAALVVARVAFDANDYRTARAEAEAAIHLDAREGAFLLLADIEEAETGDEGKVRQWLSGAVRAPRDLAWVADGVVAEQWAPVSPVTGRLDAFEWRAPVEQLGRLIDNGQEQASETLASVVPAVAVQAPLQKTTIAEPEIIEKITPVDVVSPVSSLEKSVPETTVSPEKTVVKPEMEPEPSSSVPPLPPDVEQVAQQDMTPRLPDDPGVDPDEEREPEPEKFRLF
ncbi:heme biosynthesis protein HemY [Aquamicrobium segne]|uniref:Heme biosynthesis protein HemY n=1 Tax=Aquamicrobium segne TaxID=469547 RepID=A0ABW0GYS2_9HYPH